MSTDHRHWTSWLWSTYTFFICILHARLLHEIRQLIIGTEHPGSGPHTHSSYIHSSYIYFMHALFITILLELQLIIGTEQPMHMAQVPGPKSHTRIAQRARAGTEGSSCSRCECMYVCVYTYTHHIHNMLCTRAHTYTKIRPSTVFVVPVWYN